jgi:hypothetical protein
MHPLAIPRPPAATPGRPALRLGATGALSLALITPACAPVWNPPVPAGVTYVYQDQGFVETHVAAAAGVAGGVGYGMGFGFRDKNGVKGATAANPFQQSVPIDGLHFNDHLVGQGERITPAPPAASAAAPAPRAPGGS